MADNVTYHHPSKTEEKSEQGLLDCFGKKYEDNKGGESDCKDEKNKSLLAKLHVSDRSSSSSDDECENGEKKKKKDKTLKEKVEKKIEEDKVKINVKIEEAREKALELKEKAVEKIEETIKGYNEKNNMEHKGDTCVPVVKNEEVVVVSPISNNHTPPPSSEVVALKLPSETEEKKGFVEKIKDNIPGGHKKVEDEYVTPLPPPPVEAVNADHHVDGDIEHKEKKGILDMIKEKLPGYHSKSEDEKKE